MAELRDMPGERQASSVKRRGSRVTKLPLTPHCEAGPSAPTKQRHTSLSSQLSALSYIALTPTQEISPACLPVRTSCPTPHGKTSAAHHTKSQYFHGAPPRRTTFICPTALTPSRRRPWRSAPRARPGTRAPAWWCCPRCHSV